MRFRTGLFSVLLFASLVAGEAAAQIETVPPSILYGPLYSDVELQSVFPDSKTFPDMIPNESPSAIVAEYEASKNQPGFDLSGFVAQHFTGPTPPGPSIQPAPPGKPLLDYVAELWSELTQSTPTVPAYSSLQPLPFPYVVPGGRFREFYYWDSYFTILGLEADNRNDLAQSMVDDFATEIETYGHIPNGNRSYYLSRSQPPFFSLMVSAIADRDGEASCLHLLPQLQQEYDFWMEGSDWLPPMQAHRRVVRLSNGTVLNRYWDDRPAPRDESYREDVQTASISNRPAREVYRNLRAAAESGWDFSSRWLADGHTLATIRTVSLLPVDLNSLLAHLEQTLARLWRAQGDEARATEFDQRAAARTDAITRLMWDPDIGAFSDYLWRDERPSHNLTAATLFPLFFKFASPDQGAAVASTVRQQLLMPGGLATTLVNSGQQWDEPNGWAPLQLIAVEGLTNYGETDLAEMIAERWVDQNISEYEQEGKLVEKYNVVMPSGGMG
ncbi:MAG: alpha,alpha-trehalase TreA, partial [Acetobacteraceae bacterium]|nr:alpha,alpha-trehalase TreA [Acetobacteraceae bacterium]